MACRSPETRFLHGETLVVISPKHGAGLTPAWISGMCYRVFLSADLCNMKCR